jgi:hypothetical protein
MVDQKLHGLGHNQHTKNVNVKIEAENDLATAEKLRQIKNNAADGAF